MAIPGLGFAANVALGGFLVILGAMVLRKSPDRAGRTPLGLYLGLVGVNYLLDGAAHTPFFDKPTADLIRFAGLVPVFIDPPMLLLFALALRPGGYKTKEAAAIFAFPVAMLGLFALLPPSSAYMAAWDWRWLYTMELGAYYIGAFVLLVSSYLWERRTLQRDRLGALVVAFGVVVLPRIPLLTVDFSGTPATTARLPEANSIPFLIGGLVVVALVAWGFARSRVLPANRLHFEETTRSLGELLVVVMGAWALFLVPPFQEAAFTLLYSGRWFLFVPVLASAIRRYDLLDMPEGAARNLGGAFQLAILALAVALIAVLLSDIQGATLETSLLGSVAVVAVCGAVYSALHRSSPSGASEVGWRKQTIYRAHVELGKDDAELEDLRLRLGVSERQAKNIRALVEMERAAADRGQSSTIIEGATFLGRFEIQQFLGAGAFGRTFTAFDRVSGEHVVVKELLAEWRSDPEALERFRREAETLLTVEHPNLVAFKGLERTPSGHILVLGYVKGETLRTRFKRGRLTSAETTRLGTDLLAGLDALHRHGIFHRDVKPDNVMLTPEGNAVLLDFGTVTRRSEGTRLAGDTQPGTLKYMSPEQAAGENVDARSDVYSAAVTLWEALSGAVPPNGNVPEEWQATLKRALEPDPQGRYASAEDFARAIILTTRPRSAK
ncbi:MAG: serine/threonine protein kinase [Euryarchaeota archaeon]|nr:serine/threonine protein kinase [Euryarchaeota archaeon]